MYNRAFVVLFVENVSDSCVLGTVMGTSQNLPHVTLMIILQNKYYPHFINEAPEDQEN